MAAESERFVFVFTGAQFVFDSFRRGILETHPAREYKVGVVCSGAGPQPGGSQLIIASAARALRVLLARGSGPQRGAFYVAVETMR